MAVAENYNTLPISLKSGSLEVRLAENSLEIDAAQSLRYKIFYQEMKAKASVMQNKLKRDIDDFEQETIDKYQIKYISCDQFNNNYEQSKKIIEDFIDGSKVHISFDVDCLDPQYIPSTGTRFLNGLELESTKNILDYISQLHNNRKTEICNIDLTELNFEIGNKLDNFKSLANILYLFNKIIY